MEGGTSSNLIGTFAGGRNVISSNSGNGVYIFGSGTDENIVANNYIGTGKSKTEILGNTQHGVLIDGGNKNQIGSDGSSSGDSNTIAHNGGDGVYVQSGTQNRISRNSIYENAEIGIDLGQDGVSLNDVLDGDSGANQQQNYPTIEGVVHNLPFGTTTIHGRLNSVAEKPFKIELFSNDVSDPNWRLHGKTFLTATDISQTDVDGNGRFEVVVGNYVNNVTATATDENGNTSEFWSLGIDLDVDTNIDDIISELDEENEEFWINTGPDQGGAIILPNADDDDGDNVPDNWRGGNLDGVNTEDPDTEINGDDDRADIGSLVLYKLGGDSLPAMLSITLTLETVPGEDPYWLNNSISPEDRIRIFLPTKEDPGKVTFDETDKEILGPTEGPTITFFDNPGVTPNLDDYSIFAGSGIVEFGIEGVRPGAPVMITTTIELDGIEISSDRAQVKVSPFVAFSHRQEVDKGTEPTSVPAGPTVYVGALGIFNSELRTELNNSFPGQVEEKGTVDYWWQDGFEIGYVQAPYGQMHMILALPRAQRDVNWYNDYARNEMMRDGVGLIQDFSYTQGVRDGQDMGGNFEVQPGTSGLGKIIFGKGPSGSAMDQDIVDFLFAQGVQDVDPDLDLSWLQVGHVDEVVSFPSVGDRARVASPEAAWALLIIAEKLNSTATWDAPGGSILVSNLLANTVIRGLNFNAGIGYSDKMLGVRDELGLLVKPVSTPVSAAGAPAGVLRRAGYLDGYDSLYTYGDQIDWKVTFDGPKYYKIEYRKSGVPDTDPWTLDGSGNRDDDFVSNSKAVYILKDWWDSGIATANGHEVTFTTQPSLDLIEMPVLFGIASPGTRAQAITNNVINSIVHDDTLLVARAHGPEVLPGNVDIFEWYVDESATKVGFNNVLQCEEEIYHVGQGSIHCGTNVLRLIPDDDTDKWWNNF